MQIQLITDPSADIFVCLISLCHFIPDNFKVFQTLITPSEHLSAKNWNRNISTDVGKYLFKNVIVISAHISINLYCTHKNNNFTNILPLQIHINTDKW